MLLEERRFKTGGTRAEDEVRNVLGLLGMRPGNQCGWNGGTRYRVTKKVFGVVKTDQITECLTGSTQCEGRSCLILL